MSHKRIHLFYSGSVQGVGFRYTAQGLANEIGIVGWMKNLCDGRVEVVCEGKKEDIKDFLDKIQKGPLGYYIKNVDVTWEEPTNEFSGFEIRF